ncbi:DUF6371 domain-containing protein [Pontibacter harenae]|uniref:DUF6371 domain-containing protein n=1 Tax=Pontibacter harenae TaxID=2894083 RepID=UPI001E42EEB9|nr:DUF6371 domain-containing protein [Pontibacter harenae]MCC9167596.1 toprim domain-containing protein [Pontibacter harenae]
MTLEFVKPVQRYRVAPLCPCGRGNHDGKFAPFLINGQVQDKKGHCFSCGNTFHPDKITSDFCEADWSKIHIKPQPELKFIDPTEVAGTLKGYNQNNFALWLKSKFPEQVNKLLNYFSIGTCRQGSTLFWYKDASDNYRKLKRMFYKPDGHRVKLEEDKYKGLCSPLHYKNAEGYLYCLFGEFQLSLYQKDAPVFLVESEKTAVICYTMFPQYVWLATGGANKLTREQAKVLKHKLVYIIPDMHQQGRAGALKTKQVLTDVSCKATIYDIDPTIETGEDIADYL